MTKTIDNLILIGRPASGKSEFIDYLKTLPIDERVRKFRIGNFTEVDDFPWFWEKFVEDDLWEQLGLERKSSIKEGCNLGLDPKHPEYMDLMILKLNHKILKEYSKKEEFYKDQILFVEFARGGSDAYQKSLNMLDPEILKRSVILYNEVSFEESCGKNLKRYQEKAKHSILAHKVADETMEAFYKIDDWQTVSNGQSFGTLTLNGVNVPFAKVNNEPETTDSRILDERYGAVLVQLFEVYNNK